MEYKDKSLSIKDSILTVTLTVQSKKFNNNTEKMRPFDIGCQFLVV